MNINGDNTPILVTGAGGLAGSAVVEYLRSLHYTCVMPLGRRACDLTDRTETRAIFERCRPKQVYHAAALVYGLGGASTHQAQSFYSNTLINTNVIDAAHRVGVEKITVMGSNTVYPHPAKLPYHEEAIFEGRVHGGEMGYANAKRGMLSMLEAYEDSYGTKYAYIVSGNLYGPRDKFNPDTGHVLPTMIFKFYRAKILDCDVDLWGDGTPRRDFLYSADLARIVERIMFGDTIGPINLGSGASYTIREVAQTLSQISGVSMERVKFDATKPNGRLNCTSDLIRLRALDVELEFPLYRGLQATWDWYVRSQQG